MQKTDVEKCLSNKNYDPKLAAQTLMNWAELYHQCKIRKCINAGKTDQLTFCQKFAFEAYRGMDLKSDNYFEWESKKMKLLKEK